MTGFLKTKVIQYFFFPDISKCLVPCLREFVGLLNFIMVDEHTDLC